MRLYQVQRQAQGAAPGTINWEMATLSRLFTVMVECQFLAENPVRLLKRLSTKSSERRVYLSRETVQAIADECPSWFRPIIWMAYYTGMRRGEILDLKRGQVDLTKRIITLQPDDTKEGCWKSVPIHQELLPILKEAMAVPMITGTVFNLRDDKGVRDLGLETAKNPWPRACEKLDFSKPRPRFHDLRHAWKTNARRSGMHREIEMAIMGHSERGRSVHERYGRISVQELLEAIDRMTFDHGETEIWVKGKEAGGAQNVRKREDQRKRSCGNTT